MKKIEDKSGPNEESMKKIKLIYPGDPQQNYVEINGNQYYLLDQLEEALEKKYF